MHDTLKFTEQLAREAGEMVRNGWHSFDRLTDKTDGEAVTSLDKQVNAFILERIQQMFPLDDILSEEDDPIAKGKNARLWVVDPIDGTVNMMRDLPFFCVSIALWEDGVASVGAIYDPIHDVMYAGMAGGGATRNGVTMRVSASTLESGLVLHGQPYNKEDAEVGWKRVRVVRAASLFDRQLGSAALMLCYVACGQAELMCITGTKAWDCAAGALFIREAGGVVTGLTGEVWQLETATILAGNLLAHAQAVALLNP